MSEFDVIVIGGGPGGYVAAIRCAQNGLKTACVESKDLLGGTCLNCGCIPSKSLLHSTELYQKLTHEGQAMGISSKSTTFDLSQAMKHKTATLNQLGKGIAFLFRKNKVTHYQGKGRLVDTTHVEIQGKETQTIQGKTIILAMGSEPIPLPFLPFDEKNIVSSTGALSLASPPKKMVVIGAGVIGVELASVYQRIGSEVTVVEFLSSVCSTMDETLSSQLEKTLTKQGVKFLLSSKVTEAKQKGSHTTLLIEKEGKTSELVADTVLVAVGRRPYSEGAGLETLEIAKDKRGFIIVNERFQTTQPNIYAIGDLIDGPMLAHKASEEGLVVADHLAGKHNKINYALIPNVIYTSPEVASVGLTEKEAKENGLDIAVSSFPFQANSRAVVMGEAEGLVKIIAEKKTERLLGFHIIGPSASELISIGTMALKKGSKASDVAHTCIAHPTLSEAIHESSLGLFSKTIHF